jgi:hypothetical protein
MAGYLGKLSGGVAETLPVIMFVRDWEEDVNGVKN